MKHLWLGVVIFITSCGAPRNFYHSGQVLEKNELQLTYNNVANVPTETVGALSSFSTASIKAYDADTLVIDQRFHDFSSALLAHSMDPLGYYAEFGLKFGVGKHLDLGYTNAAGVHYIETNYQLLGEDETFKIQSPYWKGSVGLRLAKQKFNLPSFLGDFQDFIGYEFKRKDALLDLAVSRSFGEDEKYGYWSAGAVAGVSNMRYQWELPNALKVYDELIQSFVSLPEGKKTYMQYGLYSSVKAGYKYFYFILSFSAYYQNYGEIALFGTHTFSGKGWTFVPNLGMQFNIPFGTF